MGGGCASEFDSFGKTRTACGQTGICTCSGPTCTCTCETGTSGFGCPGRAAAITTGTAGVSNGGGGPAEAGCAASGSSGGDQGEHRGDFSAAAAGCSCPTGAPIESSQQAAMLKAARSRLAGVNHASLPPGRMTVNPDHTIGLTGNNGSSYTLRPSGSVLSYQNNGRRALLDAGGRVRALQTHDLFINRAALGEHRIQALQPGGGTVVSFGPHDGYVERPLPDRGHALLQRTVVSGDRTTSHVYRSFAYRNANMAAYVPDVYYGPGFYNWFGIGWRTPVPYQAAWTQPGAQGFYAGYYTPPPAYASPEDWVADYVLTSSLDEGFANPPSGGAGSDPASGMSGDMPVLASSAPAPISPVVRAQVKAQVARNIAMERMEAAQVASDPAHGPPVRQDVPAGLDPGIQMFVVGRTLQVVAGTEQCQLREGAILFLPQAAPSGSASAELLVKSSLKGDCPGEARVAVSIRDLQEMSNHFRENICSAEQTIAANKGGGRLPQAPDAKPLYTTEQAKTTPEQDAQTVQAVQQLETRASQEERSVEQEMGASSD